MPVRSINLDTVDVNRIKYLLPHTLLGTTFYLFTITTAPLHNLDSFFPDLVTITIQYPYLLSHPGYQRIWRSTILRIFGLYKKSIILEHHHISNQFFFSFLVIKKVSLSHTQHLEHGGSVRQHSLPAIRKTFSFLLLLGHLGSGLGRRIIIPSGMATMESLVSGGGAISCYMFWLDGASVLSTIVCFRKQKESLHP